MREIPRHFPDLCALLWPVQCVGCGLPDRACCSRCVRELRELAQKVTETPQSGILLPNAATIESALRYEGAAREMLIALKHGGQVRFAPLLGQLMGYALERLFNSLQGVSRFDLPFYLLTLPSRRAAVRSRGFVHIDLILAYALRALSARCAQIPNFIHLRGGIRSTAGRSSQVGLSASARETNAARIAVPPAVVRRITGTPVLLVDDIVTTGASLACATDRLIGVGAQVLGAATICWVSRHNEHDFTQSI